MESDSARTLSLQSRRLKTQKGRAAQAIFNVAAVPSFQPSAASISKQQKTRCDLSEITFDSLLMRRYCDFMFNAAHTHHPHHAYSASAEVFG